MFNGAIDRLARRLGLETASPRYSKLESLPLSHTTSKRAYLQSSLGKRYLTLFALSIAITIIYFLPWHLSTFTARTRYSPIHPSNDTSKPLRSNLHVLIPASKPDPNLCKAIVSTSVLGYPNPTIINWNQTFDDPAFVEGGSHLAKINGTAQYLHGLDETHNDDLVLMMDGYDAWIQLRPQTLVDRFFNINRRANERIASIMNETSVDQIGVSQEIVFGCQKRCWPWSENDPPCYAVPESSLPANIYGPETDTDVDNEENPYIKYRQRFLNSGVALGTVGAMRRMFDQALAQAPQDANFGSDQYIFSHIFGDQELYREVLRRDADFTPREGWNEGHIEEVRSKAAGRVDGSFEFGIGLDYGSEIGLNTVFAEEDTGWVKFSDGGQLREVQVSRGIEEDERRLTVVPADINMTAAPFESSSGANDDLPSATAWHDVDLFTDVWTGISPVVIHHNAHRNGMKSLRETWRPNIWFQEHLRALLNVSGGGPASYVAVGKEEGREYWPEGVWTGGDSKGNLARVAGSRQWLAYSEICGAFDQELFRDGMGWT